MQSDAEAGNAEAMSELANAIRSSNPMGAAGWDRRAAELGNLLAMHNLAVALWPVDRVQALGWWRRSAEGGHILGTYGYGWALDQERSPAAIGWWRKVAEMGNVAAMYALGLDLKYARPEEAGIWLQAAVDLGDVGSMVALAGLLDPLRLGPVRHRLGPFPRNAKGRTTAASLLAEASAKGSPEATFLLGYFLLQWEASCLRIPPARQDEARGLLTRAAELGSNAAMRQLYGSLRWHRPEEAHVWLERCAAAGDSVAGVQLALAAASRSPKRGFEVLGRVDDRTVTPGHQMFVRFVRYTIRAAAFFERRVKTAWKTPVAGQAQVLSAPRLFRSVELLADPLERAIRLLAAAIRQNTRRRRGRIVRHPPTLT